MSIRRDLGEVVQLDHATEGPLNARIHAPYQGPGYNQCVQQVLENCKDSACREWWTLEVLDDEMNPSGEHVYHVSACAMRDVSTNLT